jgi:hypothetical protein
MYANPSVRKKEWSIYMGKNRKIEYDELDKHFTAPKVVSPFYKNVIRVPRKTKKMAKLFCGVHWKGLTNEQRLWHFMECENLNYKRFLIKKVCEQND